MVKEVLALDVSNVETEVVTPRPSEFTLIDEADTFFNELQESIRNAKSTIQFQSFLFDKGSLFGVDDTVASGRITKELEDAARRGVHIQVMTDGMFPFVRGVVTRGVGRRLRLLQHELQVKAQSGDTKVGSIEFKYAEEKRPLIQKGLRRTLRALVDRFVERDHTKNLIIDPQDPENGVAYIGGRNVWRYDEANTDFMVRIKGEMVGFASQSFQKAWEGDSTPGVWTDSKGNEIVRDVRNSDIIFDKVVNAVRDIKQRVWLQTPYFDRMHVSPYLIALRNLNRSLDVRLSTPVPPSNNHRNFRVSGKYYLKELAEEGIDIWGYRSKDPREKWVLNHGKGLLIDGMADDRTDERAEGLAVVGSSNFNKRRIIGGRNAEVNLFIRDPQFILEMEKWFEKCFTTSIPYQPENLKWRYWLYRKRRQKNVPSVEEALESLKK